MGISRFALLRKTCSLKMLKLSHFSIFFHEISELHFALNLQLRFLKNYPEKNWWPNYEILLGNFRIWPIGDKKPKLAQPPRVSLMIWASRPNQKVGPLLGQLLSQIMFSKFSRVNTPPP